MSNPVVTINLVVLNGEKYIRHCLDAILAQSYPHEFVEFNILDNGSSDSTKPVIENYKLKIDNSNFSIFKLVKSDKNWGMWPGQEELLKYSKGKYVLTMAVDVMLDKDFIKNAVEVMESDPKIGGLQAKIYKYEIQKLEIGNFKAKVHVEELPRESPPKLEIGGTLDTCGFAIYKSRRVINIGHGEEDKGQYDSLGEIFGVEGAAPFLRREALENLRISGEIFEHDFFWYADDLDFVWRMNLFGWKQVFAPSVIAWHDRQTTKKLKKNFSDFLSIRRSIPLRKRQLEWKNIRFTILKNDYIINILKDLPYILKREISMFVYLLIFEPRVFWEIPNFIKLIPKMTAKRSVIMKKAVRSSKEIDKFFQ